MGYCPKCKESVVTLDKEDIAEEFLEATLKRAKQNRYAQTDWFFPKARIAWEFFGEEHFYFSVALLILAFLAILFLGTIFLPYAPLPELALAAIILAIVL